MFFISLLISVSTFLLLFAGISPEQNKVSGGDRESSLTRDTNELFAGSGHCSNCHGEDAAANRDSQGRDVSPATGWRSTLVANSALDPYWLAKVSHEGSLAPERIDVIETTCTRCHAPAGNLHAIGNGSTVYTISEMQSSPLALDGVTCTVCHLIAPEGDLKFNGQLNISGNRTLYGQFFGPYGSEMLDSTGYTVAGSDHISRSEACASCHTLTTQPSNFNGAPPRVFYEQTTYQEWTNSRYVADGVECQTCHMPRIDDEVRLSNKPSWIPGRSPFALHTLVGGNTFMLEMLRDNAEELGLTASAEEFNASISASRELLVEKTADLELRMAERTSDSITYRLEIRNNVGHKFPSGFPSARAFVEFIVLSRTADTIFASGLLDNTNEVQGIDPEFEPHYNLITRGDQVQIYEMVAGGTDDDVTFAIDRMYRPLKDNRLVPVGFRKDHYSYDSTEIVGLALEDEDFNAREGVQGSGGDIVWYRLPLPPPGDTLTAIATLWYQSVPPRWVADMFAAETPEINAFRRMYQAADGKPERVASAMVSTLSSVGGPGKGIRLSTITTDWTSGAARVDLHLDHPSRASLELWASNGRLVGTPVRLREMGAGSNILSWDISTLPAGIYFVRISLGEDIVLRQFVVY